MNVCNLVKKNCRGRPKTLDREKTIHIALESYSCEGPEQISLNEICRRAGISKPAFYREFGSEEGLKQAVLECYANKSKCLAASIINQECSLQEKLLKFSDSFLAMPDDNGYKGCLIHMLSNSTVVVSDETRAKIQEIKNTLLAEYERMVEMARTKGELVSTMENRLVASYIFEQLGNAFNQKARGDDPDEIREMLKIAFMPLTNE